jgi:hypothetical protein
MNGKAAKSSSTAHASAVQHAQQSHHAHPSHAHAFARRDPEVQRFLKAQPTVPVPRHQLASPPPPGLVVYQLLPGHRVIRNGD